MLRLGEVREALSSSTQSNEDGNSMKCAIKSEPTDNADTHKLHTSDKEIEVRNTQEYSSSTTPVPPNQSLTDTTTERLSTSTATISGKENKRTHQGTEDEELEVNEDGGVTSLFALSVAKAKNACPPVEEIATRRGSPKSSSRKKRKTTKKMVLIVYLNRIVNLVRMEMEEMFIILPPLRALLLQNVTRLKGG